MPRAVRGAPGGVFVTKGSGRTRLVVRAFGPNAYEPLERAIRIVNKVISIGEKAKWKDRDGSSSLEQIGRERWVQFGAVTSAKVPVSLSMVDEDAAILLREYLSLPTSEYSLLDPRWVERGEEDGECGDKDTFMVKIPLQDIVGVDLTPTISIVANPHKDKGKVTFVGSKASLGSPGLDEAFTLNVVAVLNSKDMRGNVGRGHLPGKPVRRLRKWASNMSKSKEEDGIIEYEIDGQSGETPGTAEDSSLALATDLVVDSDLYLQCRVNVTMAIRVPSGLKVIPNPLLGYAGRLITKSVLHAAVPNFANLLGKDFENWDTNVKSRDDGEQPVGDMFEIAEYK